MVAVIRIASGDPVVVRASHVSLPWRFLFNATGVVTMKNFAFAARSHIRNVVLCSLLTFGLAACGADEGTSSSAAGTSASGSTPSLVMPNVGLIDRSRGDSTSVAANTTGGAATTTPTTATATPPTAPAPSSGSGLGSTTAATNPSKPSTGVATLDWTPPTENSDGSVLTNLAGYTVYYGTSPGSLDQSLKITNPGLTAYTLTNLPAGTWYFAVTSYSSTGVESTRSGVVSTRI
jgi:hypothetical protein